MIVKIILSFNQRFKAIKHYGNLHILRLILILKILCIIYE